MMNCQALTRFMNIHDAAGHEMMSLLFHSERNGNIWIWIWEELLVFIMECDLVYR